MDKPSSSILFNPKILLKGTLTKSLPDWNEQMTLSQSSASAQSPVAFTDTEQVSSGLCCEGGSLDQTKYGAAVQRSTKILPAGVLLLQAAVMITFCDISTETHNPQEKGRANVIWSPEPYSQCFYSRSFTTPAT